jgi:hypothetical protein
MIPGIMEAMRKSWTDEQLDGLCLEDKIDARFDGVHHALFATHGLIIAGLFGVLATQL